MPRKVFTTSVISTNQTVELDMTSGTENIYWTKMTLQSFNSDLAPASAGTITIKGKVDKNPKIAYQTIGTLDLGSPIPLFIEGSYEDLQFVGSGMTGPIGTDVFVNGDFGTALGSEWVIANSDGDGSAVITSGQLVINQGATAGTITVSQALTTIVGDDYTVTFDLIASTVVGSSAVLIGTTSAGSEISNTANATVANAKTITFTATSTTTYITLQDSNALNVGSTWDNIKLQSTSPSVLVAVAAHSG